MAITKRRASSSRIASGIKTEGHLRESDYAALIEGEVLQGIRKGDVKDKSGKLHSVKSGKKWQIFLYSYDRIQNSAHLNILLASLEAFPEEPEKYFKDREKCLQYKEKYLKENGREKAKKLTNEELENNLENENTYVLSKKKLQLATTSVSERLKNKNQLRAFLQEAIFNNHEVDYLAIKSVADQLFYVFSKDEVIQVLTDNLFPDVSKAGRVPQDYNVPGQKTLLCYLKGKKKKNIVEIEIRNDSDIHYRQVRFNMYSKDATELLLKNTKPNQETRGNIILCGKTIDTLKIDGDSK